jgi:hypothetical protein
MRSPFVRMLAICLSFRPVSLQQRLTSQEHQIISILGHNIDLPNAGSEATYPNG